MKLNFILYIDDKEGILAHLPFPVTEFMIFYFSLLLRSSPEVPSADQGGFADEPADRNKSEISQMC